MTVTAGDIITIILAGAVIALVIARIRSHRGMRKASSDLINSYHRFDKLMDKLWEALGSINHQPAPPQAQSERSPAAAARSAVFLTYARSDPECDRHPARRRRTSIPMHQDAHTLYARYREAFGRGRYDKRLRAGVLWPLHWDEPDFDEYDEWVAQHTSEYDEWAARRASKYELADLR